MEVLLVEDQALTVQVFAAAVRRTFDAARVYIAVDLPEALQLASGHAIDLVLLDLGLPTCSGIDALQGFRKAFPAVPVLVVSVSEEKERIQACLEAGARGYLPKSSAILALPSAMKVVAAGGLYVPPQAQSFELH